MFGVIPQGTVSLKRIPYLSVVLSCLTSFIIVGSQTIYVQAQDRKPNIILILSDDAGYADFSFQSGRLIPTPHIDRIAGEGVQFSNAYVTAAVCSPSRAGLLTGVNQAIFGQVYNFIQKVNYTLPIDSIGLPVSQKLAGEYLKPLGYATGIVGKWHEGFARRFHPNNRGFDYFWGFLWGSSPYTPGLATQVQENGSSVKATDIPYMTDAIGDRSLDFIEKHASQPFFLYVAFNAPHTPMQAKPEKLAKYKGKFGTDLRAINAAMTESMDENVGRILAKLQSLNLLNNTIVVFTNDNGGQTIQSAADNYPLKGKKGEIYEGGIRVPMALMWKDKISPGKKVDIPVTTLDLLPAFINAAGGDAASEKQLQGTDIIKLAGARPPKKALDRNLYWYLGKDLGAIRSGKWKLAFFPDKKPELYDLNNDISESSDLAKRYPAQLRKLEGAYRSWKNKLPAPLWVAVNPGDTSADQ